ALPITHARTSSQKRQGAQGCYSHHDSHGNSIIQIHSQRRHLRPRSEEHTSELQSRENLVCRLLLEKKKKYYDKTSVSYTDSSLSHSHSLASFSLSDTFSLHHAPPTTELYPLSLHDALPICPSYHSRSHIQSEAPGRTGLLLSSRFPWELHYPNP